MDYISQPKTWQGLVRTSVFENVALLGKQNITFSFNMTSLWPEGGEELRGARLLSLTSMPCHLLPYPGLPLSAAETRAERPARRISF
jgi:hypothetical protein